MRVDSAGATHELLDWAHDGNIRFSVGYALSEAVREATKSLPESAWSAARSQDGSERPNGEVAEITDLLSLWPQGSRVIVRRERPHPGAQLSFTDHGGHRFQAILTDQVGEIAAIERRHRARARVEDQIRDDKDTGMAKLPFRSFEMNAVRLSNHDIYLSRKGSRPESARPSSSAWHSRQPGSSPAGLPMRRWSTSALTPSTLTTGAGAPRRHPRPSATWSSPRPAPAPTPRGCR